MTFPSIYFQYSTLRTRESNETTIADQKDKHLKRNCQGITICGRYDSMHKWPTTDKHLHSNKSVVFQVISLTSDKQAVKEIRWTLHIATNNVKTF